MQVDRNRGATRDVLLAEIRSCCVPIYTPLQPWPARPSTLSAKCLDFPMASQLWPEGLCASACASWRSNTAGICLSRTCPHKDARELILRTMKNRTKMSLVIDEETSKYRSRAMD